MILIPTISGIASFIKKFFDPSDSDTGCNEKSGSQESTIDQLLPNLPEVTIPIIRAFDPNEILSPTGCGTDRWVTKNATLPYTILFENSPDFATAPAQRVVIELPLDEDLQAESFRVGNFGFGNYYFTVPANVSYYNAQLDLSDSLGVLLDVVAGVDVNSAPPRAFWIFESKDPATGLAANLPANAGFLPVNDTLSHIGEGFVNFTLRAHSTAVTYDTLHARAAIIFDDNPPILTNLAFNLLDADLPASHITDIDTLAGDQLLLSFLGDDVGSGIAGYTLYISENGGPFLPLVANLSGDNYTFQGTPGSSYEFFLIATDCAGNVEPLKNGAELECALSLTLSQTPSTNGQSNGSASVQVAGNLGSLSYLWSNNATTASINNVPAGTYSVSVTDGLGCSNFGTITVDNVTGTASINKLFIQRIYPSPAPNNVNVEFFSPDSVVFIELYDARGNKLSGRSMRVNAGIINTIQLDVSELPTANYLIVVRLKDAVISGIFMKG
ncbi:MAG: hypothetical protein IPN33_05650 [Saprospiraceae bacterium]|nr:hypothetical protein [Saprospiraceae bacterium]